MATTFGRVGGGLVAGSDCWSVPRSMTLTSFYGGKEFGRCLQLTIQASDRYIGLTHTEVLALIARLSAWAAGMDTERLSELFGDGAE